MNILNKFFYYKKHLSYKNLIIKIFKFPIDKLSKKIKEKKVFSEKNNKDIFTKIYEYNYWGDKESKSGIGSSTENTISIRIQIPVLVKKYNIKNILDVPCGDFLWFSKIIDNLDVDYLGGDIVENLVIQNNKKFSKNNIKFKNIDLLKDDLPDTDLLICRDCLFHLSYLDIKKVFRNFINSNIKYFLITNHNLDGSFLNNKDIITGSFRFLDFYKKPFYFKNNYLEKIDDSEITKTLAEKNMLLFTKKDLENNIKNFI